MPSTDPGCSGSRDKSYLNALASSSAKKGFADVVRNCTLTKGCLAKTRESEKVDCIAKCVQTDVQNNLSYQCSVCHAQYGGDCLSPKCLLVCAVDSPDCAPCLAQNCDAKLAACVASGANPGLSLPACKAQRGRLNQKRLALRIRSARRPLCPQYACC